MAGKHISSTNLTAKVEKLREKGIDLRLSDEEIDQCILDALKQIKIKADNDEADSCSRKKRVAKLVVKCLTFNILCLLALYLFVSFHEPTQKAGAKFLAPYSYGILRFLRKTGLPARNLVKNVERFYTDECMLHNPFYEATYLDCDICRTIRGITKLRDSEIKGMMDQEFYMAGIYALITHAPKEVSFSMIQKVFHHDSSHTLHGFYLEDTNMAEVSSVETLMSNITEDFFFKEGLKAHFHIYSTSVKHVGDWRKLFSRPALIPNSSDVTIFKRLFVDGPDAEPYTLPLGPSPYVYYIQGQGVRDLHFEPLSHCERKCKKLSIKVYPKDVVLYDCNLWKVRSLPDTDKGPTDLSVAFMASFVGGEQS